jgi:hypothetical protein
LSHEPETGFNRLQWNLDTKGVRSPQMPKPRPGAPEPGGLRVLPGTFKVVFTFGTFKDSTTVTVIDDPRQIFSVEDREKAATFARDVMKRVEKATQATDRLREAQETLELITKQLTAAQLNPSVKKEDLLKKGTAVKDSLKSILDFFVPDFSDKQGIFRTNTSVSAVLGSAGWGSIGARTEPGNTLIFTLEEADRRLALGLARVNAFFAGSWKEFEDAVKAANPNPFKEYKPIE